MELNKTNKYLLLALFWTACVTVACLVSISEVPEVDLGVENADKLVHFTFYAVFSILWFLYLKTFLKTQEWLYLKIFIFAVSFGIMIEICQSVFTDSRQADAIDAIANTLGSLFGLTMLKLYNNRFKK